ncbi:hypothetical protein LEP1GSC170_5096 [Leptospira interrogans serovar Bataviae str. HAI135]|nr:hypothetical protein LEP1GSC170_5096 [Leptospira interrogans serovar Bataviae str. HAI135]
MKILLYPTMIDSSGNLSPDFFSLGTSAISMVNIPTRPQNIIRQIKSLPAEVREGVIPLESPAVPNAETTS